MHQYLTGRDLSFGQENNYLFIIVYGIARYECQIRKGPPPPLNDFGPPPAAFGIAFVDRCAQIVRIRCSVSQNVWPERVNDKKLVHPGNASYKKNALLRGILTSSRYRPTPTIWNSMEYFVWKRDTVNDIRPCLTLSQ